MSTKKLIIWILAFIVAIPAYFWGGLYVWSVVKSTYVDYNTLMTTYEILKLTSYSGVVLLFAFICWAIGYELEGLGGGLIVCLIFTAIQFGLMVMCVYFNWVEVASIGYILYNVINVGVMIGTFGNWIGQLVEDNTKSQKESKEIKTPLPPKVVRDNSVDQRFVHLRDKYLFAFFVICKRNNVNPYTTEVEERKKITSLPNDVFRRVEQEELAKRKQV